MSLVLKLGPESGKKSYYVNLNLHYCHPTTSLPNVPITCSVPGEMEAWSRANSLGQQMLEVRLQ
ncbi:hypothetical protein P7K49_022844, partial [Saguinus oedipus]